MDRYDPYTDKFIRDTISRQAAIDALCKNGLEKECSGQLVMAMCEAKQWAIDTIEQLPSAQPEINCSEFPNNSDIISRQAAIEVIDAVFPVDPMKSEYAQGIACGAALAKTYVEQLPPAEPKRGRWIPDRSGAFCCSHCMEPCATYVMMKPRDRFCKMCGAKMEVTE